MRLLALLAAIAVLAGGCFDRDVTDDEEGRASSADGYALDCSIASTGVPGWTEPCLALASPNESPSKTEIDLAVNPTDPMNVFVASKDLDPLASPDSCVWAVGQVTHDGGHTWTTVYVGGTMAQRTPTQPLFGWRCITDPILQYAPDGTLHYSLQAYDYEPLVETPPLGLPLEPEGGNMYQAISTDGGATFPTIEFLHAGDEAAIFHDYMRMAHNPQTGTVFTLWNQITAGVTVFPVLVAVDAAGQVRPPVYFAAPEALGNLGLNTIVGAPDGAVHALFSSGGSVYQASSADDGRTFSLPTQRFDFTPMQDLPGVEFRSGSSVEVAVDRSGGPREGCLFAVVADGAQDVADLVSRSLCPGDASWGAPTGVSVGPRGGAQFFPRISVDGRGTVHVVSLTQAYDPDHRLLDAEWARSTDGGQTWTVQRLTATSFDGDLGIHQNGFPFIGDYIGIDSVGDHTYMAFPTTVTGRAEIAVAHAVAA